MYLHIDRFHCTSRCDSPQTLPVYYRATALLAERIRQNSSCALVDVDFHKQRELLIVSTLKQSVSHSLCHMSITKWLRDILFVVFFWKGSHGKGYSLMQHTHTHRSTHMQNFTKNSSLGNWFSNNMALVWWIWISLAERSHTGETLLSKLPGCGGLDESNGCFQETLTSF